MCDYIKDFLLILGVRGVLIWLPNHRKSVQHNRRSRIASSFLMCNTVDIDSTQCHSGKRAINSR